MSNYLVDDILCGCINPSTGEPYNVVRTAITTSYSPIGDPPAVIGTVIARTSSYFRINATFSEFTSAVGQANENSALPTEVFNKFGIPMYFMQGDTKGGYPVTVKYGSLYFSQPIVVSDHPDKWYTLFCETYGVEVIHGWGGAGIVDNEPLDMLVIAKADDDDDLIFPAFTNAGNPISQTIWHKAFLCNVIREVDISVPPNSARPIPANNSLLPAPSIVRFGLTLEWDDFEIADYYVKASSDSFGEGFSPINDYSAVEISDGYSGLVYVTITHEIYDVSADATYEIVQAEVYDPGGIASPGGGTGNYNDGPSDDIRPLVPSGSAGPDTSNVGLYTRYLMTSSQIKDFGDYLYADDIVESITQGIMKALFDSPAEAVISLMHYPFDVSSLVPTSGSEIYYGNIPTGKSSSGIMNRSSARIEWGTLPLTEYWGNFLDYAPHTKIDLYLPWCTGSVPIDPHECLPGTIEVITNIEFDKGTCVHNVIGNKGALIGTYSGVVGTQIPVTALDTAGKALSFVTAAVSGIVAAGATGASMAAGSFASQRVSNAMGFAAANSAIPPSTSQIGRAAYEARIAAERPYTGIQRGAGRVAAASSAAAFRVPPNITRNGSFSGNGASLAVQVPFIIISRPTQSVPQNYGRHYGYPSNIYASLGSLVGYTEVGSVHLDGFTCTVEERNEIGELLMGGVVL